MGRACDVAKRSYVTFQKTLKDCDNQQGYLKVIFYDTDPPSNISGEFRIFSNQLLGPT